MDKGERRGGPFRLRKRGTNRRFLQRSKNCKAGQEKVKGLAWEDWDPIQLRRGAII